MLDTNAALPRGLNETDVIHRWRSGDFRWVIIIRKTTIDECCDRDRLGYVRDSREAVVAVARQGRGCCYVSNVVAV